MRRSCGWGSLPIQQDMTGQVLEEHAVTVTGDAVPAGSRAVCGADRASPAYVLGS